MLGSARMSLTVDRVGVEANEILVNLFDHYLHDMSQWFPIKIGLDGLAGFAVVSSAERWINERDVNDVKEFFVDAYTGGRFTEQRIMPDGRTRVFCTFDNSAVTKS